MQRQGDTSGNTRYMKIKRNISSIMGYSMTILCLPININILRKYSSLTGLGGCNVLCGFSRSSGPCGTGVPSGSSSLGGLR